MAGPQPNRIKTSELKSRILNVAQTSVYQVKIQPPGPVDSYLRSRGFNYSQDGPDVELMCSAVNLPAPNLRTIDVSNDYAGVTEKMVYRKNFNENVIFSFMVNNKYDAYEMFEGWVDYITGYSQNVDAEAGRAISYRMNYPDTYRSDNVYITKFEKNSEEQEGDENQFQMTYQLIGAYPISLVPTQLSYDRSQVLRFDINMTYIKYIRKRERLS